VLLQICFFIYTAGLSLFESHGLSPHIFINITHRYSFNRPAALGVLWASISECTTTSTNWFNTLQLNTDKTKSCGARLANVNINSPNGMSLFPWSGVRNLGTHIEANLVMKTYVHKTVSRCFAVHRQRQIRGVVPQPTIQSLMITMVNTRKDARISVLSHASLTVSR